MLGTARRLAAIGAITRAPRIRPAPDTAAGEAGRRLQKGPSMTDTTPTEADLEALIKPLWKATRPSKQAQRIRGYLTTSVDDARFPEWALDYVPDYVWDLVDIAAQRGLDEGRAEKAQP